MLKGILPRSITQHIQDAESLSFEHIRAHLTVFFQFKNPLLHSEYQLFQQQKQSYYYITFWVVIVTLIFFPLNVVFLIQLHRQDHASALLVTIRALLLFTSLFWMVSGWLLLSQLSTNFVATSISSICSISYQYAYFLVKLCLNVLLSCFGCDCTTAIHTSTSHWYNWNSAISVAPIASNSSRSSVQQQSVSSVALYNSSSISNKTNNNSSKININGGSRKDAMPSFESSSKATPSSFKQISSVTSLTLSNHFIATMFYSVTQVFFILVFLNRSTLPCTHTPWMSQYLGNISCSEESRSTAVTISNAMLMIFIAPLTFQNLPNVHLLVVWVLYGLSFVVFLAFAVCAKQEEAIPMVVFLYIPCILTMVDIQKKNCLLFWIHKQLKTTMLEFEKTSEESQAQEMRHMIANIAHDLKTVSSLFGDLLLWTISSIC